MKIINRNIDHIERISITPFHCMNEDTERLLDTENPREIKKQIKFSSKVKVYSDFVCPISFDELENFLPKSILLPTRFSMRTNLEGQSTLSCLAVIGLLLFLSLVVVGLIYLMQKLLFIEMESSYENASNSFGPFSHN